MKKEASITIAITGPESTGKSWLARELARYFHGDWLPEYAREYLDRIGRAYTYGDILNIAKQQHALIHRAMEQPGGGFLFLDTELTVIRIWCEYKFGRCHSWIREQQEQQQFDFYLLTGIDLPWQPDPLREHPDCREELFELYRKALTDRAWPFEIVTGSGEERLENAIRIIEKLY